MGEKTKIAWTDATWSPWWGCQKVSPACANCYAETFSHRLGMDIWGQDSHRKLQSEKYWNDPVRWNRKLEGSGERKRVFCASMADVFEDRRDLDPEREKLWRLIDRTPNLDWLLLTKRTDKMTGLAPASWRGGWPDNVWAGTTVENQEWGDLRVPILLDVPAKVRFLSVEPMLGPVELGRWLARRVPVTDPDLDAPDGAEVDGMVRVGSAWERVSGVAWVIVGAESGARARPMDWAWVRSLRDECVANGVPFFLKQAMGPDRKIVDTPELDGRRWVQVPRSPAAARAA